MNCSQWSNRVYVDEVARSECRHLCKLLEAIFAQAVGSKLYKICKERCCGCKYDHPSQRQHNCLMLTDEEKWKMYGLEAIVWVIEKLFVWREFIEAIRVLKLKYYPDVEIHMQQLEKDPDSEFVNLLMELYLDSENCEFETILNYLFHWRESR